MPAWHLAAGPRPRTTRTSTSRPPCSSGALRSLSSPTGPPVSTRPRIRSTGSRSASTWFRTNVLHMPLMSTLRSAARSVDMPTISPPAELLAEVATGLLASATELGHSPDVVATTSGALFGYGFVVPQDVFDHWF